MKNLNVYAESRRDIRNIVFNDTNKSENCLTCLNSDNDHLYILRDDHFYDLPPNVNSDVIILEKVITSQNCIGNPIAIEYCSILESVICALDHGTIFMIDINNHTVKPCEYFSDGGISCIKLSPDHEILVLIDKFNAVHVLFTNSHLLDGEAQDASMNGGFLDSDDFGEKQFITVGWGKKETQFHGSEGKAAAKVIKTSIRQNPFDDGSVTISWRGDGTLFAVSFVQKLDSVRKFKVFSREGILQYSSELVDGLDENLSWKPSGNLIATSQALANKSVIALFEKNGLKHRDFLISPKANQTKIKNICWSLDSEVMSLLYIDTETGNSYVQLWTEKNYHWYLKQTIHFTNDNSVLFMNWSSIPKSGKKLFILTSKEQRICTYRWTVDSSKGKDESDKSIVGVIDGENVLLTSFRDKVVPPPMAQYTLNVGNQIKSIVFSSGTHDIQNTNSFFCVLNNLQFVFYEYKDGEYLYKKTNIMSSKDGFTEKYSMNHFVWLDNNTILCSASAKDCLLLIMKINDEHENISIKEQIVIPGFIEHILQSVTDIKQVYIFDNNHTVSKYIVNDNILQTNYMQIEESFNQIDVISIDGKDVFVCRTNKHCLYINNKNVSNNITSFYVHSEFLMMTTLQHTLLCFSLKKEGLNQLMTNDLTIKPWENENSSAMNYLNLRRIERGATLIISVPKDARTILQMPRGNLECIQPRTLSLFSIAQRIDQLKYHEAFDLMRKQRINLNLLYDHDPENFMKNVHKFVNDIGKTSPSWLSLFLSELKEEDVTRTTYVSCYSDRRTVGDSDDKYKNKIQKVCKVIRLEMEKSEKVGELVQAILISLVKENKNVGVIDALKKVKELQLKSDNGAVAEALKSLLYMVDVNDLFDAALGMYDLDLTMLIAQKSQKDPKEYVPFLNNFKNMQEDCMRFEIDKHLKRYDLALSHLAKLPDKFEQCIEFIKTHNLYTTALKLFAKVSASYKEVANIYGEHLSQLAKYEEAGIMFAKAEKFKNSMNALRLAGCWQECIVMAQYANLSSSDTNILYKTLVSHLKSEKKFKEASTVASRYMNDALQSVFLLCEGKMWMDAWREAITIQRYDIIESHVKPGILEYAQQLLLQIQNNLQEFDKYKARLEIVRSPEYRKAKQDQYCLPYECDFNTEDGINDLLSDTASNFGSSISSSHMSRTTGRSNRSSRNRRKQQRKLLNIKEGSLFEDLALLRALHNLILTTYSQKVEVRDVVKILLTFNEDDLSERLYKELDTFLHVIDTSQSKIWIPDNQTDGSKGYLCGTIPEGLIEPSILHPPKKDSGSWTLGIFKISRK